MIPRTIHYCWFGKSTPNQLMQRCIQSWRAHVPEWNIVEWSERNVPLDNSFLRTAYTQGLWAHVSDYVRLRALSVHGGVYLDTDVELRRSLDNLRSNKCFVGFQSEEPSPDWVNNAVLGAEPGHPFLDECLKLTLAHFEVTRRFPRSPAVTTQVLRMYGLQSYGEQELNGVAVYPTSYFYPHPWFAQFREELVSDKTHCVHYWQASWRNHSRRDSRFPPPPASAVRCVTP